MTIKGILITQNDQDFIIGKATVQQILTYTKYTERLIVGYDENDYPIYNDHIQRKVESARVEKIADFLINDPFAIFPTNIVLGIPNQAIESQTLHDNIVNINIKDEVINEVTRANNGEKNANIYYISKLMRAVIFYMRYSNDSNSYKEDVERAMRFVSDNVQNYEMHSKELDLLLRALRTIYKEQ